MEDGLAKGTVYSILQDQEGRIWFGTWGGGVSRYNPRASPGQAWTTFTNQDGLAHDKVRSILQDREGYFWFGTRGGVSRYDPTASPEQAPAKNEPGQAWTTFTTEDGLAQINVSSILQDREGYFWFGTRRGGVSRYDPGASPGQDWITFNTEDGLADNNVRSILQDRDGNFWFGTRESGVSRYDPSARPEQAWTTFTVKDGLANSLVLSILQDWEGHIWFGTYGGVSRYDPSASPEQAWTTFTSKDGLAHNAVRAVLQDREGLIWFGTYGGVSRYEDQVWTTFTTEDGLGSNDVGSIYQDRQGHIWFGTLLGGGLSRYDGETFTTTRFSFGDGSPQPNTIRSIFQDSRGLLWFSASGALHRYDPQVKPGAGSSAGTGQAWTTFTTEDGLAGNVVRQIIQDREGHLWICTHSGVSRYDGKTFTTFGIEDGLAAMGAESILQDREGNLWFGTWGGVSRYNLGSEAGTGPEASPGQAWTTFTMEDGLASNRVWSIIQDRSGNIWFGTFAGVSRFDGENFTTYTKEDGLAGSNVHRIVQDRAGHLWFTTGGGGVSRYDGRTFQNITRVDGLASNYVWSGLEDSSGDLWFGTTDGVTRYRPPAPFPPPVVIDAVVADHRYEGVPELAFPSTVGLTAFEFHGMSFKTRADGMVYRYRLKGYEKDWQTTRARRIEYQDLPQGTYTFELQAVDRDLGYSETPATVALTVHLPYGWIGLLIALGIAVVLTGWQTTRVVRRDSRLRESNKALSDANKELFQLNKDLLRERAVERIREQVQSMEQASDFENVLSLLAEDLHQTGLQFETCGIDVLNEPVDEPTMAYFEANGFGYTTYTIEPDGAVTSNSYHIPAPFPPVYLETIKRFIAGQPWQGRSEQTAILEVPASGYGRLRITTSDRQEFTEEEIQTLNDFAGAVALGYARFLDFKAVEAAQQKVIEGMERELQTAHDMQMGLLPESPPEVEGIELSGICIPANHVGGDYYNFFYLDEARQKVGIFIADVSGKAMQAATVAMRFNEILRYEARGTDLRNGDPGRT